MKILITGGAGFVGSNLALMLKSKYNTYQFFCLDNLKRRGSELNIPRLKEAGIEFIHGDIRNKEDLDIFSELDFIIDASAEPSVLAGINSSSFQLINSNLIGTVNCLELAKKIKASFIFLSTSRIYPIKNIENIAFEEKETRFSAIDSQELPGISSKGLAENFPLEGARSLYGATKLASELIIQEYNDIFGVKAIINRFGVITGPWQMGKVDQGVVVLWLARHFWKKKLSYVGYGGTGKQVRDILHVADLVDLVDYQIHNIDALNGEIFNAGGGNEVSISLKELTQYCQEITGNTIEIEAVQETRMADIRMYITDNSKVTAATGWVPKRSVKQTLQETFDWMKANEDILKRILE